MNVTGIVLTNPDRGLYPGQGLTKHDLAAYYDAIAPLMLPHVAERRGPRRPQWSRTGSVP